MEVMDMDKTQKNLRVNYDNDNENMHILKEQVRTILYGLAEHPGNGQLALACAYLKGNDERYFDIFGNFNMSAIPNNKPEFLRWMESVKLRKIVWDILQEGVLIIKEANSENAIIRREMNRRRAHKLI